MFRTKIIISITIFITFLILTSVIKNKISNLNNLNDKKTENK